MSEFHDPRQKMLADTLDGEWSAGPAAMMAARAAAHARRRSRTRRTLGSLTSVATLAVIAFLALHFRDSQKKDGAGLGTDGTPTPGYTIISDEQLIESPAPLLILTDEMGVKKIVLISR